MKIGVTGANGFIGEAVVNHLKNTEGVKITALDRIKHNLLDYESLQSFVEGQDAIIHLAGVNRGTNRELLEVNTLGMLSLLDAVVKFSPSTKIVFASTFQIYLPQSLYGLSKKFAEDLLGVYGTNHKIQSTILRLSNVYGPGGKPFYNSVIATFAHLAKQAGPLKITGDGSQERDFIYLDDVVKAIAHAATYNQKETTEIIDICSGKSVSLREVITIIEKVYPKKFDVVYNGSNTEVSWPTKDKDYKKAEKLLGWKPTTSLTDGLTKVMNND